MSRADRGNSLYVSLKPHSEARAREIQRLRAELAPIVRLTASGDFTAWNLFLWNLVIAKCRGKMNKFEGIDEATESLALAFEQAATEILGRSR